MQSGPLRGRAPSRSARFVCLQARGFPPDPRFAQGFPRAEPNPTQHPDSYPYPTVDRPADRILDGLTSKRPALSCCVRLSVITPTRNRADLWRSGWLADTLAAQVEPPDELIIALDHTEDDTLAAICSSRMPFPVRILEVLEPRQGPNPASASPDNCLFAAATGDIILHLDDDLAVHPNLCRRIRDLLDCNTQSVIWPAMHFVNADHSPVTTAHPLDSRTRHAQLHNWPTLPGGIVALPRPALMHWGAAYAVHRANLLAIGGHCRQMAALHNADTRLGNRLVKLGLTSYLGTHPELQADHLGLTWYQLHKSDPKAISENRGPSFGVTIANGGPAYWTSETCRQSYRVIKELDTRAK
jgi:glycosyltransferase involved in cell wall biosynthesis